MLRKLERKQKKFQDQNLGSFLQQDSSNDSKPMETDVTSQDSSDRLSLSVIGRCAVEVSFVSSMSRKKDENSLDALGEQDDAESTTISSSSLKLSLLDFYTKHSPQKIWKVEYPANRVDKVEYPAIRVDKVEYPANRVDKVEYPAIRVDKVEYPAIRVDKVEYPAIRVDKVETKSLDSLAQVDGIVATFCERQGGLNEVHKIDESLRMAYGVGLDIHSIVKNQEIPVTMHDNDDDDDDEEEEEEENVEVWK
eukprot:768694-Hanusia_phi.AAC.3